MKPAKTFQHGNSQALRLPRSYPAWVVLPPEMQKLSCQLRFSSIKPSTPF